MTTTIVWKLPSFWWSNPFLLCRSCQIPYIMSYSVLSTSTGKHNRLSFTDKSCFFSPELFIWSRAMYIYIYIYIYIYMMDKGYTDIDGGKYEMSIIGLLWVLFWWTNIMCWYVRLFCAADRCCGSVRAYILLGCVWLTPLASLFFLL